MAEKIKPYVICFDTWDVKNYFCLDRGYGMIPPDKVEGMPIKTDQMLEAMVGIQASFNVLPDWAENHPEACITIWTNYYEVSNADKQRSSGQIEEQDRGTGGTTAVGGDHGGTDENG